MKKLSRWAKENDISYVTAFNWFKKGLMPVKTIQTPSGSIFVIEEDNKNDNNKTNNKITNTNQ